MVQILPLRGLRYAPTYASGAVYAPPYDVIDPLQHRRLLERSPFNAARLILNTEPGDSDWHATAAATLARWRREGVLRRDDAEAFYGYCQEFALADGVRRTRRGFIGRVRLSEWGVTGGIHRHEHTRSAPRADRLKLTRATRANLSPVFGLYHDGEGALRRWLGPPARPEVDFVDEADVRQVFWPIADPRAVEALAASLAGKEIVIADGHHRYETALAYRDEQRAQGSDTPRPQPYDYVLMYLTDVDDTGLVILPTHRLIHQSKSLDEAELLRSLTEHFLLSPLGDHASLTQEMVRLAESAGREEGRAVPVLGLGLSGTGRWLLRLRSMERARVAQGRLVAALAELDVSLLQNLILQPYFGITPEALSSGESVSYVIDEESAYQQVKAGAAQAAFILNPTPVEQVWQVARRGLTMPPKSTYFYPKLLTGLVMNPLDEQ